MVVGAKGVEMSSVLSIGMVVAAVTLIFVATRPDPKRHQQKDDDRERSRARESVREFRNRLKPRVIPGKLEERHRLRTDRLDLQSATGVDFATRELPNRIWPPLR